LLLNLVKLVMLKNSIIIAFIMVCLVLTIERNILWDNDRALWEDSLEKAPNNARSLSILGIYFLQQHEYAVAVAVLQLSLAADPYQPRIYSNLGLAYQGLERFDLARDMYTMAIGSEPDNAIAYYNLGVITYNQFHDLNGAFELFQKARDRNLLDPDVHLYLSRCYHDLGNSRQSDEELRRYLSLR
jgi:tetratricopeptide (TPR) repeat protein